MVFDWKQIYTAVAYGLYGDASLGAHVRNTMIDTLRELANWLESSQRSDIAKVWEIIKSEVK